MVTFQEITTDDGVVFRTETVTIFPTTEGDPGGTQIDLAEFQQD
jgi:hypothetical protein